jgi:hypothetical protein
MISYELALKLKNAGFPQEWKDNHNVITNDKECDNPNCLKGHKTLYCHSAHLPILEELIEACREEYFSLMKSKYRIGSGTHSWSAEGKTKNTWITSEHDNSEIVTVFGPTPSEAVANLWLKLNKK